MFHGSMVALVTPMQKDTEIDKNSLKRLIEMHIEKGTDALVVVGTTGESGTLDFSEKRNLIRLTVDVVANRLPVIVGSGATSTRVSVELTKMAMDEGADACLLMTPAYVKPTQEGLFQHYQTIAHAVAIPQILYNVPGRTACDLLPATIERLAKIPNIIGVKEATASLDRARDIHKRCGDQIDIYSGDDLTAMELMLLGGAKGVISVTANVAPRLMKDMCDAARVGNMASATEINDKLLPLHKKLFVEANPIPTKWALHEMGIIPEGIRLPLTPLSKEYHAQVRDAMCHAGLME